MKTLQIYHNPRCSKSRQTLALLNDNQLQPEIIEYLKNPPTKAELSDVLEMLGFDDPRQMMRVKETDYVSNNLSDAAITHDQLIDAMVRFPKLIERPIVINGDKARIGRPPESVLDII